MDSNYISPSTGQLCTASQYISEVVCTRKAKKDGCDLAFKFWNKKQKDSYKATIVAVCKLIEEFGEKEVVSYFLKDGTHIYSVGWYTPHAWLKKCVAEYCKKYKKSQQIQEAIAEKPKEEPEEEQNEIILPKPKKKKTLFGVLNGEEERI